MAKKSKKAGSGNSAIVWAVLISLVIGLVAGYMIAKVRYTAKIAIISEMVAARDNMIQSIRGQYNKVSMNDGQMMVVTNGKEAMMTENMTLGDGTKVTMEGYYQRPNQEQVMLNNGESLDMMGNLIIEPTGSQMMQF